MEQKMKIIEIPDHLSDIIPPEFDHEKYEYTMGPAEEWEGECECEVWICQKNPLSKKYEKKWKNGGREVCLRSPSMIYRRIKKKDRWELIPPEQARPGDLVCTPGYFNGIEDTKWNAFQKSTEPLPKNWIVIRRMEEK